MKRALLILLLLALPLLALADFRPSWLQRFSMSTSDSFDEWQTMEIDAEGNIYVAGRGNPASFGAPYDIMVAKYNNSGTRMWWNSYNGAANLNDGAYEMALGPNGRIYVTGYSQVSEFDYDAVLVEFDAQTGGRLGIRGYRTAGTDLDDTGNDVVASGTHLYWLVNSENGATNRDVRIIKYTFDSGVPVWERNYDRSNGNEYSEDLLLHGSHVYACGGTRSTTSGEQDMFALKYDLNGNQVFTAIYDNTDTPGDDNGVRMAVGPDNSVYVAGSTYNGSSNMEDPVVVKFLPSAFVSWARIFPNVGYNDSAIGVTLLGSDRLAIAGKFGAFSSGLGVDTSDILIAELGRDGSPGWTQTYNGPEDSYDDAFNIFSDALGNVYVHGYATTTPTSNENALLLRYTSGGVLDASFAYGSSNFAADKAYAAALDPFGNLVWAGLSHSGGATGFDATVAKYYQTPVAINNHYVVDENAVLFATGVDGVLTNDFFKQYATCQVVTQPSFGTLTLGADGYVYYSPSANFRSTDTFQYRVVRGAQESAPATVTIDVVHRLKYFTLSSSSIVGGNAVTGTVTVTGPANPANVAMSDNSSAIVTPSTFTVPLGATSVTSSIGTMGVSAAVTRQITASFGGRSITRNLTLNPATLSQLLISPSTVIGGQNATGEVRLTGTVPGARSIALTDNSGAISTPASVNVNTNQSNAFFTITTTPVTATATRQVTGTYNGVSRSGNLTLNPGAVITNLVISPNTVQGGNSTNGTVTISANAPAGGTSVAVTDNSSVITTPASVTVNAGTNARTFAIGTAAVTATATRQVTVSLNGTSRTANLTLTP